MKIKTLAVIGLLALAPVQTVELNAASNATVKVARDNSGKVDYKNFYKNGSRVKYEDWNKGKKVKVTNYKNGKVTSKTYYKNGEKTKFEKWSNGKISKRTTYKAGKVTSKTYYSMGIKTKYQRWENGKITEVRFFKSGKMTKKNEYYNGTKVFTHNYKNGKIVSTNRFDKKGNVDERVSYKNGYARDFKLYHSNGSISEHLYFGSDNRVYAVEYDENGNLELKLKSKSKSCKSVYCFTPTESYRDQEVIWIKQPANYYSMDGFKE